MPRKSKVNAGVTSILVNESLDLEKPIISFKNIKECKTIVDYLLNPTHNGIWELKFSTVQGDDFTKYLKKLFQNLRKDKEKLKDPSSFMLGFYLEKSDYLVDFTSKISNIFSIFKIAYEKEMGIKNELDYYKSDATESLFFDNIDYGALKIKFKKAYKIFKDKIYYPGFFPIVLEKKLIRIVSGNFLLDTAHGADKNSIQFNFISTDKQGLKALVDFLDSIGKVKDYSINPTFSPEEKVYKEYFFILEGVYQLLIEEENIQTLIKKSIDEYRDGNYPYSISNIGLIAEEFLTIIYETLFREQSPKNMTLGKLYDRIAIKTKEDYSSLSSNINSQTINAADIYKNITENISKNPLDVKDSYSVIRQVLRYIEDERKRIHNFIRDIRKDSKISIFPKKLKENTVELINYRNSISHKTKIPIGYFEALRAIYCCMSLIMWWKDTVKDIDWDLDRKEIIASLVSKNHEEN